MEPDSDQILIDEILQGNENAFKQLVEKYQAMVTNTCMGFLHSKEDSEDIAQEVFIEVYNSLKKFRKEARLSTWMYRIAVNKSLNFLRSRNRRNWILNIEDLVGISGNNHGQVMEKHNPAIDLENKETAEILHRSVSSLPENQRIAITLNKYEELSYAEIAEIMGVSLAAVESLIHRAKLNLQKKLLKFYKNIN